jgi:hypothetical protein
VSAVEPCESSRKCAPHRQAAPMMSAAHCQAPSPATTWLGRTATGRRCRTCVLAVDGVRPGVARAAAKSCESCGALSAAFLAFCLLNPWDSQGSRARSSARKAPVLNLRKPVGGWAGRIHARPPVIVNHIVRRDGRSPRSDSVPYLVGQSVGPTRHQQSPGRRPFVASNLGHPTSPVCFSVLNGSVALHRSLGKSRDDDIRKPDPRNARSNGGRHPQAMASFAAHRVDCPPANVERADAPILRVAPVLTLMLIVVRQPSTELPKSPLGQTKTFTQQELRVNVGWRP